MDEIKRKVIKKKKPMRYRKIFKLISILMVVITLIFLIALLKIDVLGFKYLAILISIIILIEGLILLVINKRFKLWVKVPFIIGCFICIFGFSFGLYNINLAKDFAMKIVNAISYEEKYNLYVLVDSEFEDIKDLNKKNLGVYDNSSDTLEDALRDLKKKVTFKNEEIYDDLEKLFNDCISSKIDAFYMTSSLIELANEEYPDLFYSFKQIAEVSVSTKSNIKKSSVDVTKDPFLVYISGIDTYGSIANISRSDVNILVAVNPKTNRILLVNTPRDYYVKLHSKKAYDKLTHAGIYGVEESMTTLGDLYSTEVDFYIKLNFSSLIKIVDTLGGITVNSKYAFSYDGYTFQKGINRLDGKAALAFSRFRKGLPLGDVSRGENQEAVISGLIEKVTDVSIITKYKKILETLGSSVVTNLDEKDLFSLAKYQLNNNPKWQVETKNAKGRDAYNITYSAGKTKLYVMEADENSVTEVKEKLNEILEED